LTGGGGYQVLREGEKDAHYLRRALKRSGYAGGQLRDLVARVEPLTVAHRLPPERTWLFYARNDRVIPTVHAKALADTIGLRRAHRRELAGNHDTAHFTFPAVLDEVATVKPDLSRRSGGRP